MIDAQSISEQLAAGAMLQLSRTRGREIRTLKGVRGVPDGEIARIASATWKEMKPTLSDEDEIAELFRTAWEDGMVAVGLIAAIGPDHPTDVFDWGVDLLQRTDDSATADALGWLVLGPTMLAAGFPVAHLISVTRRHEHPAVRRAGVMSAMAMTPTPIEGPAAAPLRARMNERRIAFVEQPWSAGIAAICTAFLRDEDPSVRKAMRRVLRAWADCDTAAQVAWADATKGGLPKMLRAEVDKARTRLARQQLDT